MNELIATLRASATTGNAALAHKQLEDAIAEGADRQEILNSLGDLISEFHIAGNEVAIDIVTEIGDRLTGWCHPSSAL